MSKQPMPQLLNETIIANGLKREVYEYTDSDLLLKKVATGYAKPPRRFKRLIRRYFPQTEFRYLLCEIHHEMKIQMRSQMAGILSPLAPTRGLVQTQGEIGLLVQRIGPKTGGLGMTLDEFTKRGMLDDTALIALNDFAASFFSLGVVARDISRKNIVWGEVNGVTKPFLIDGFGDRRVIKIRTWVRWHRHRLLHLGMEKTAASIDLNWCRTERQFYR